MIEGRYGALLRERIAQQQQEVMEIIADPGVQSWDEYQKRLGYIRGLQDVLALMDEVAKDMEK